MALLDIIISSGLIPADLMSGIRDGPHNFGDLGEENDRESA